MTKRPKVNLGKSKWEFSVIIPVYNVELYLDEAIESIVNQTIGFLDNCELILVDDGSTDSSAQICQQYVDKYPNNIKFLQQKNLGPGEARNAGAKVATGKYISMPDSDDKLSLNTFELVAQFFEKHGDEVDVVTIPWEFFEARTGRSHPLNYKFTHDRVVDLDKDWDMMVGSVAPSFFKREVFDRHMFDRKVGRYSEDLHFMSEVLLDKHKYGILCDATYYYRKRRAQTSSQDGNTEDLFWYHKTPKLALLGAITHAKKRSGRTPRFVQYMVMYDLQWRYRMQKKPDLPYEEVEKYRSILRSILQHVDDEIIVAQKNINTFFKLHIFQQKYGDIVNRITVSGNEIMFDDIVVGGNNYDSAEVKLDIIERREGALHIEGFYGLVLPHSEKIFLDYGGKKVTCKTVDRPKRRLTSIGEPLHINLSSFEVEVDLKGSGFLEFVVSAFVEPVKITTIGFSGLSSHNKGAYRKVGDRVLIKSKRAIAVKPYSRVRHVLLEARYLLMLLMRPRVRGVPQPVKVRRVINRLPVPKSFKNGLYGIARMLLFAPMFVKDFILKGASPATKMYLAPVRQQAIRNVYSAAMRIAYYVYGAVVVSKDRPLWLFMDRVYEADDSAEVLFKYVIENPDQAVEPYFTVSGSSDDYGRLAKVGPVVDHDSLRFKLMFLHADKVLSSHADDIMINAFEGYRDDFVDLYSFDFVFLQHGIIKDDISNWLHRHAKNIKLFVTSASPEYESILAYDYGYDETVVKLTGLARYDRLQNDPGNTVVIAPTWREWLAMPSIKGKRGHSDNFKSTAYYKFYQSLISNARFLEVMSKNRLQVELYLHPSFAAQSKDFQGGSRVKVMSLPYDYAALKKKGVLMVTDYSSVAFDFAYLRKPVVYSQFDDDEFWRKHTSKPGYFSYEKDGFGPVTKTVEATVDCIERSLKKSLKVDSKYTKRIDKFFAFNDDQNAHRIYKAILDMDS